MEEIENEISEIEDEYKQGTKCFIGICPDFVSYRRLSKHVVQANVRVRELMENCKFEESLIRDAPPSVVESLELPNIM